MLRLSAKIIRIIGLVVTLGVVAGVVYFAFLRGDSTKTVTANFTEAVGIYKGTPVKILGVDVGEVTSVTPKGGYVAVTMEYDSQYKVPQKVSGVEVANSLVSDRYVQLAPVYRGGPVLSSGATIPLDRTSSPAELDDIYGALNKLSVALGPSGANKGGKSSGALSTLLNVAAANLKGNGAALGNSISKLAAAARTLADGRTNLFQTVQHLRDFTQALSASDQQVRLFNQQLAQVGGELANERTSLGLALHDLSIALDQVDHFVHDNANRFHTSITGLESITGTLVKEKDSLEETLAVAPVALANIVHAYQPNLGVLATRSNLASLTDFDPKTVCALLYTTIHTPGAGSNILGTLTKTIDKVCTKALGSDPAKTIQNILGDLTSGQIKNIGKQIGGLLGGGGLGGIIGGSSSTGSDGETGSGTDSTGTGSTASGSTGSGGLGGLIGGGG